MIYSINNIKKKDNKVSINNSISLFESCLSFIKENNTYRTIGDTIASENIPNLNLDGFKRVVDATCDTFVAGIKETYEKYLLLYDDIMIKVKNKISKDALYSIDDSFTYNDYRYKYTNLRRVLSYSSLKTDINRESAMLIHDLNNYIAAKQISEYYNLLEEFKKYQENININIAMICATILGKNGPVDKNTYGAALFGNFREYRIDMDSYISKDELLEIYDRYISQDKEKAIIKNDFDKYNDDVAIIKSTVESIPFDKMYKDTMNSEFTSYPKDRIFIWINMMKIILDIYQMFFAARLDACLESLTTDIDILLEARKYVESRQLTDANRQ